MYVFELMSVLVILAIVTICYLIRDRVNERLNIGIYLTAIVLIIGIGYSVNTFKCDVDDTCKYLEYKSEIDKEYYSYMTKQILYDKLNTIYSDTVITSSEQDSMNDLINSMN